MSGSVGPDAGQHGLHRVEHALLVRAPLAVGARRAIAGEEGTRLLGVGVQRMQTLAALDETARAPQPDILAFVVLQVR